jgi:hypothetical protein
MSAGLGGVADRRNEPEPRNIQSSAMGIEDGKIERAMNLGEDLELHRIPYANVAAQAVESTPHDGMAITI